MADIDEDTPDVTRGEQLNGVVQRVWADAALYHQDPEPLLRKSLAETGLEVTPDEFDILLERARHHYDRVPVTDSRVTPAVPNRVENVLTTVRDVGTGGIHASESPGSHYLAPNEMFALRAHSRGGPEVLVYEQAHVPELASGEVLIEVHAASITFAELGWDETWERDGVSRTPTIPSHEFSGVIVGVADDVSSWARGDEVFGLVPFDHDGAAAEYLTLPESIVARRPTSISHVDTAALPLAALTAWQALVDHGNLVEGQQVLIHGGAGGVGVFVVQLAHDLGAVVTATARPTDFEFVSGLGADRVLDFESSDWEGERAYDLVIDPMGGDILTRSLAVLAPGGHLIDLTDVPADDAGADLGVTAEFFVVSPDAAELTTLAELIDGGRLRSVVQATFPLVDGRAAFESGSVHGKRPGKTVLVVRA